MSPQVQSSGEVAKQEEAEAEAEAEIQVITGDTGVEERGGEDGDNMTDLASLAEAAETRQTEVTEETEAVDSVSDPMSNIRILNPDGTLSEAPPGLMAAAGGDDQFSQFGQQQFRVVGSAGEEVSLVTLELSLCDISISVSISIFLFGNIDINICA
jgi:hypothetical protein